MSDPTRETERCSSCGNIAPVSWHGKTRVLCQNCTDGTISCEQCGAAYKFAGWTVGDEFWCLKCQSHLEHDRYEPRCAYCVSERIEARAEARRILQRRGGTETEEHQK